MKLACFALVCMIKASALDACIDFVQDGPCESPDDDDAGSRPDLFLLQSAMAAKERYTQKSLNADRQSRHLEIPIAASPSSREVADEASCGSRRYPFGVYPIGYFASAEKENAMAEVNITCEKLSVYGAHVPKKPQWMLTKLSALKEKNPVKIHNYNFQGSLHTEYGTERPWVHEFIKGNFVDGDFLKFTDEPSEAHESWGAYDHTGEEHFRPKDDPFSGDIVFDADYYLTMIQSNFTLCPSGDHPWSERFYEAIMAGSIPLINSTELDLLHTDIAFWFDNVGYKYFTTDQMPTMMMSSHELENIAQQNYELFLQYQTFTHGDQVPPAYNNYTGQCASNKVCAYRCEKGDARHSFRICSIWSPNVR